MPKPGTTTEASFQQIVVDLEGHAAPLELWLSDEEIARQLQQEEFRALTSRPRSFRDRRVVSSSGRLARTRARRCPSHRSSGGA